MTITWTIRRRCPTANDWHGAPRWKYLRIAEIWLREFPPATVAPMIAAGPRRVHVERIYPRSPGQRRYDDDNLLAGTKPILDALAKRRWLVGDSPRWCRATASQRHPREDERQAQATVVTVSESLPPDHLTAERCGEHDPAHGER